MGFLKGYKTVAFFILSGVAYIFAWPLLTSWLDPQYIAIGSSIVGVLLRYITDSGLGSKGNA